MRLSVEEKLIVNLMVIYTKNSFNEFLDLSEYAYNGDKLLEIIERCQISGLIYNMVCFNRVRNVPRRVINRLSMLAELSDRRESELTNALNRIMHYLRDREIKCVIGGKYAALMQFCGKSDFFIDELTLYVSEDVDLSGFADVPIKINVENEQFFKRNFNAQLKTNYVHIETLYKEMSSSVNESLLDDHVLLTYIMLPIIWEYKKFIGECESFQNPPFEFPVTMYN